MHTLAIAALGVVASHDDKAVSCAWLDPDSGAHTTTGLGAPCARIAILSVQPSVLGKWPHRPSLSPSWSKGASSGSPLQGSLPDAEAITACVAWPKPSATSPTPNRPLCGVQSSSHALPASLGYRKYRRSKIRQPGRKSADALSPKRTGRVNATLVGTTFPDPRRPPSLGHLVIWSFGLSLWLALCSTPPAAWSLQPLQPHQKTTTRCR
jgi:hypothetical protein